MACVGLLSKLSIYCIPSCSYWRHDRVLASSIFMQWVLVFFHSQSNLLVDCCDASWWVLSGWFLGHKKSLDSVGHLRYSASPWLVVLFWVFAPICLCSAVHIVSISCCQCWPCQDLWRLALFVGYPRNGKAEVERRSHRWVLGAGVIRGKIENWALLR